MGLIQKWKDKISERDIKKLFKEVEKINALEPEIQKLTDKQLQDKTYEFKERLEKGETLDDILYEAFAVVREASKRVMDMRHYDVQLLGGIVLHRGNVAEMKTGEGKTLVATLPVYLNALTGNGVHVITVNEYLVSRDAEIMGQLYNFLGLTVGVNLSTLSKVEKKLAYQADITYGTNSEFGFDYLRDNMVQDLNEKVQKPLNFVLIDEVDSVLIDEARTPLIISGAARHSEEEYIIADRFVKSLKKDVDYTYDVKQKNILLTDEGITKAERFFNRENLYEGENVQLHHHINQALRANYVMQKDVDYVKKDDKILIVDQFTGRIMDGRRFSDGLHQAIEAKENVPIQRENKTLATITLQNYFRMYKKIAGMTGTAKTEEEELRNIYGLSVVVVPTNKPIARIDKPDLIYKNMNGKFKAVVKEISRIHTTGQPILIGTANIETSEYLSTLLNKKGIEHVVLNAKNHEKEAEIIALAGQKGAVTISTNMAGRGTDIKLGEGVLDLGGLYVIGTERHESRRIDNQLRGRAGRQGDPGVSQFFISMEDELMKRFGADSTLNMMERLGFEEDQAIESKMITKAIEQAQKRVEGNNFDARKNLLEYDNVLNEQRDIIYSQRNDVLKSESIKDSIIEMIKSVTERSILNLIGEDKDNDDWNLEEIVKYININLLHKKEITEDDLKGIYDSKELIQYTKELVVSTYEEKEETAPVPLLRHIEKQVLIQTVDRKWMDHIDAMSQLRQGIHLRAYGQTDPLREYQFEGYNMFEEMVNQIEEEVIRFLLKLEFQQVPAESLPPQQ